MRPPATAPLRTTYGQPAADPLMMSRSSVSAAANPSMRSQTRSVSVPADSRAPAAIAGTQPNVQPFQGAPEPASSSRSPAWAPGAPAPQHPGAPAPQRPPE